MNEVARQIPSAEAVAFCKAERPEFPALSAETAWAFREAARADSMQRAERALARYPMTIENQSVAGIPCVHATPRNWDGVGHALFCFGGGFFSGSACEDLTIAAPLAEFASMRITLVDYRLAPEHPYPCAIEDGFKVYCELAERRTFSLIGESAGGNLALNLLQYARASGIRMPERVALLSPWCDLTLADGSPELANANDPTLSPVLLASASRIYARKADLHSTEVSPVLANWDITLPQILVTTGSRDLLRSQVIRLVEKVRSGGNECRLMDYTGMWHVFEFYDEVPEAEDSLREIGRFLQRT